MFAHQLSAHRHARCGIDGTPLMQLETARKLYLQARGAITMASPEWNRLFDQHAKRVQVAAKDPVTGHFTPIATLMRNCPYDDEEILLHARDFIEASVLVAEEAFDTIRRQRRQLEDLQEKLKGQQRAKDYAAQCAMACAKPAFRQWLHQVHGVDISDNERVATRVRSMLDIKSRSQLNNDERAAGRWKKMMSDFENWQRNGR